MVRILTLPLFPDLAYAAIFQESKSLIFRYGNPSFSSIKIPHFQVSKSLIFLYRNPSYSGIKMPHFQVSKNSSSYVFIFPEICIRTEHGIGIAIPLTAFQNYFLVGFYDCLKLD